MPPFVRVPVVLGLWSLGLLALAQPFDLTIVHTNDLHAHLEATKRRDKSFGGYARTATVIREIRRTDKNTILLNAGDTFQGTLFFNVYVGLADLAIMNAIGYDAMTVGNHEFDRGPKPLADFAKMARFPIVSANLDLEREPLLKDLIQPSTILEVGGQKVGVIGLTTPDAANISSPGDNVGFRPVEDSVRRQVAALEAQGIDKIVLLSHIGYEEDVALAPKLRGVDVIVGGHSHSLLGPAVEGLAPPAGPYPTVAKDAAGETVLIVQAHEWGKTVGKLKVRFDEKGRVTNWAGSQPVIVDESVAEDPLVSTMVAAFLKPIAAKSSEVIGRTTSGLSRDRGEQGESLMGNAIADAMLEATKKSGAVMAFMNAGGVRAAIEPGEITYGMAIGVQPFNNTLTLLDLTGAELKAALEHGLSKHPTYDGAFLHVSSGTRLVFDSNRPAGDRITELIVAGKPWSATAIYRVCTNSFTAGGGDFHDVLKAAKGYRLDTGLLDVDALIEYLRAHSPLDAKLEGRIRRVGG
ncbi:MAG: 5'-nucleotidase C-terminal domain-containing protein [Fimbriimonadaceae bacterium]|nr:5'-nucleotidase C-terminal domain-containing protein [Fimbriimonadaceae bacterium]